MTPSLDYVEAIVELGGDASLLRSLYEQMRAYVHHTSRERRRGKSVVLDLVPPHRPEDVADHSDVQQHYAREANDAHYIFNEDGVVEEVRLSVTIRATTPGVRLFYTGHTFDADRRPGVLRIEEGAGGSLVQLRESPSGAVQAYFELDHDLAPSDAQPHVLSWRVLVDSSVRTSPILTFHCSPGTQRLSLRADFKAPALPQSIWWFSAPDTIDAEHPRPDATFASSPGGSYSKSFDSLTPGWSCGLGWVWN
ncbi:hypothetical protein [Actinokineospora sp. HUAS TT18]|uniref:hypothetical protein n=1 Tax=Actinokineospora sp. HUAS TT18 TaxID=3447451 RepID=UPI003F52810F